GPKVARRSYRHPDLLRAAAGLPPRPSTSLLRTNCPMGWNFFRALRRHPPGRLCPSNHASRPAEDGGEALVLLLGARSKHARGRAVPGSRRGGRKLSPRWTPRTSCVMPSVERNLATSGVRIVG